MVQFATTGITLPFPTWMKVLELGGGERPSFHPNMDCRWEPQVDIVADLNWPLPVPDESYDGVYTRFVLEHISWRKARQLISEVHRILRPGGLAVITTANLEEQCKLALQWFQESKTFEQISEMIFGSQEFGHSWDAGSHHCGFSKQTITKTLKEASFYKVEIIPIETFPGIFTDMTALAWKSGVRITGVAST